MYIVRKCQLQIKMLWIFQGVHIAISHLLLIFPIGVQIVIQWSTHLVTATWSPCNLLNQPSFCISGRQFCHSSIWIISFVNLHIRIRICRLYSIYMSYIMYIYSYMYYSAKIVSNQRWMFFEDQWHRRREGGSWERSTTLDFSRAVVGEKTEVCIFWVHCQLISSLVGGSALGN